MIYYHKDQLIQLFDPIVAINTEFELKTRFCAIDFHRNLLDFEFNFLLTQLDNNPKLRVLNLS